MMVKLYHMVKPFVVQGWEHTGGGVTVVVRSTGEKATVVLGSATDNNSRCCRPSLQFRILSLISHGGGVSYVVAITLKVNASYTRVSPPPPDKGLTDGGGN